MILSTDDAAIVEVKAKEKNGSTEFVALIHCEKGKEEECIKADKNIFAVEIKSIKRKEKRIAKCL